MQGILRGQKVAESNVANTISFMLIVLSHDGSAANFGNDAAFAGQKQRGTWER
jgi:hypothetical protein